MSKTKELDPQTSFVVSAKRLVATSDLLLVQKLYQPMMGYAAKSLYDLLVHEIKANPLLSERKLQKDLFLTLNIGLQDFQQARERLEALGLLKTYFAEDALGPVVIYEVNKPLSPEEFFQEDLLNTLLLSLVGEEVHQQLKSSFNYQVTLPNEVTDLSKSLLDVFSLSGLQPWNEREQAGFKAQAPNRLADLLDLAYFEELLKQSVLDQRQILNHAQDLITLILLYKFNELELRELLEQSSDLETNQVDFKKLQLLAQQKFEQQNQRQVKTPPASQTPSQLVDLNAISDPVEREFISACETMTPAEFLQSIKRSINGFTTRSEHNLLNHVMSLNILKPAVLNVLIHYIVVDQQKGGLTFGYFEKIADDWAQKGLENSLAALNYVRYERPKELAQKAQKRQQKRQRQVVQRQTLPDWAQPGYEPPKVDAKRQAELDAETARLMAKLEKQQERIKRGEI